MTYLLREVDAGAICQQLQVSPLLGKLLAAGDLSAEQQQELLHPSDVLKTSQADCIKQAVQRIRQAKEKGEKVFIGGDYDADGICSTAIMKDTLDRLGIVNGYYIPDRFKEGYGLRPQTVRQAAAKGYTLLITVDNGVKAQAAVNEARQLGMDTIVSDHHQIEEDVPADILVHPDLMEPEFRYLSGAGVALQLSRALLHDCPAHTALAAIAAIGDVMPLWRQTRTIVRLGMQYLRQGVLPSVTAMLRPGTVIDETAIAFQIVPKLNAVGRMQDLSNVNTLVRFLLERRPDQISAYAAQLNRVNEARKQQTSRMTAQAEQLCTDDDFLLLYSDAFQEGLCGLVAGRLAASLHKPCLVMARSGDLIKGSGRSVPGFNLFDFFAGSFPELTAFGGHEQAVGLSVPAADFEPFCRHVRTAMAASGFAYQAPVEQAILIDPHEITLANLMDLELLSPLPKELQQFLFAVRNPQVLRRYDSDKIVKYIFAGTGEGFTGILYRSRGIEAAAQPAFAIGRLSLNRWRDRVSCQLEIDAFDQ